MQIQLREKKDKEREREIHAHHIQNKTGAMEGQRNVRDYCFYDVSLSVGCGGCGGCGGNKSAVWYMSTGLGGGK